MDHNSVPDLSLRSRVAEIEARLAITDLLHRYAYALDAGNVPGFLECFAEDAVWRSSRPDGRETRFVGHGQLADFVTRHIEGPSLGHKHLVLHPAIVVEGSEAGIHSYFLRIDRASGAPSYIWATGTYRDAVICDSDGRWRFSERHAVIEDGYSEPM